MQSFALYDVSRKTCFDMLPYGKHLLVYPNIFFYAIFGYAICDVITGIVSCGSEKTTTAFLYVKIKKREQKR